MEPLDLERIRDQLDSTYVGQTIVYESSMDSTNDVAKTLAEAGTPEGTLVVTDVQHRGKGRLGRTWLSPAYANLLLSLVFYPNLRATQTQRLTMICSLAAVEAIRKTTDLEAAIKWPNDLLLGGKKTGGILTELGCEGDRLAYVIVGIGLNVNLQLTDLPPELHPTATSIAEAAGHAVERETLLCAFLTRVETRYEKLKAGQVPQEAWVKKLATLGQRVQVRSAPGATQGDTVIEGWAETVDADGALILRLPNGQRRRVVVGDVTLRKDDA